MRNPLRELFIRLSIRGKVMALVVTGSLLSLGLGVAAVVVETVHTLYRQDAERVSHVAKIVADFSAAPLAFADAPGATERLAYLETVPDVVTAQVLDGQARVFARWRRPTRSHGSDGARIPLEPAWLGEGTYVVREPVRVGETAVGEVRLQVSTRRTRGLLADYLRVLATVVVAVSLLSLAFAYWLQGALTRPIQELARATRRVSEEGGVAAPVPDLDGNDELAELFRGFNAMLAALAEREAERDRATAALTQAQEQLEERVRRRTAELQAEVAERRVAEARLTQALDEQQMLLREVHHRVKNNLQVVHSLLTLQAADAGDSPLASALEDSRQRIQTMAIVHQLLYGTGDAAGVDIRQFIERITESVSSLYWPAKGNVVVAVTVEQGNLGLDQAVPVGLILNELLTNAFKYAFPGDRGGRVDVRFHHPSPGRLTLCVIDDGVGLAEDFAPTRAATLGFRLVNALCRQLDGHLAVSGVTGTRVCLEFPRRGPD